MHNFGDSIKAAKAFNCEIAEGSVCSVVLVRVDGEENRALNDRGYRSEYDFIIMADAGTERAYSNRHEAIREHPIADSGSAFDALLSGVSSGKIGYEQIVDGMTYKHEDVKAFYEP